MNNISKKVMILSTVLGFIGIVGIISSVNLAIRSEDREIIHTTESAEKETPKEPEITTKSVIEYSSISYTTETIQDANLEYGKTEVRASGQNGRTAHTFEVTYQDGKEISRKKVKEEVVTAPVKRIIAKGTKIIWRCSDYTSYDKNPYNDNKCTSSTGEVRLVSDSQARALDRTYSPGQSGHWWYNSR